MISTDKAMDMLPYVVDILDKLDTKQYILQNKELFDMSNKAKALEKVKDKGFDFLKFILKNAGKVKEEVYHCLSIIQETTVEEIRAQSFGKTFLQFKKLLEDDDLLAFFGGAM